MRISIMLWIINGFLMARERSNTYWKKFKSLKAPLKAMNRVHFFHISARLLLPSATSIFWEMVPLEYPKIRKKKEMLVEVDRLFLAHKSKCTYLLQGDRCTKFFYDLIKRNNKNNAIVSLTLHDGISTTDSVNISHEFVQHFWDLFVV